MTHLGHPHFRLLDPKGRFPFLGHHPIRRPCRPAAVMGQSCVSPHPVARVSAAPSLATQTTKAITVANDGKIFLDTIPVTLPELEQRLVPQKPGT